MAQAQVDMSLKGSSSVKSSKPSSKQERSVKEISLPYPPYPPGPPTIYREPKQMKRTKSTTSFQSVIHSVPLHLRIQSTPIEGNIYPKIELESSWVLYLGNELGGPGDTHLNTRVRSRQETSRDIAGGSTPYVGVALPLEMICSLTKGLSQLENYSSYNQQRQN
ncbi:unnamed protein product [Allacma fusca]|uniref:Uncharacterized protein n=1 Tax=Allacma fusca TaxID=39272 RepID=A0A8J2K447_9HEXA|nr:unnamed protein product [Allacma fusca]